MSYILEAIKRSERQRLVSGVGALRTVPAFGEVTKQPSWLLYGAASAVLVAAGIGIGWLQPWQQALAPSAAAIVAPEPPPALPLPATAPPTETVEELHVVPVQPYKPPERVRAEARTRARPPRASVPATTPDMSSVKPPAALPLTAPGSAPASPTATRAVAPASIAGRAVTPDPLPLAAPIAAPAVAEASAANPAAPPSPAEGAIRALYELPPQVLRDLPAMAISGFIYSDTPGGRMVYINDHLVQEGQYVADGLRLEQITPDSLIFSYRNFRFRKYLR